MSREQARQRLRLRKRASGLSWELKEISVGKILTINDVKYLVTYIPPGPLESHVLVETKPQCLPRAILMDHAIEVVPWNPKRMLLYENRREMFVCECENISFVCLLADGGPSGRLVKPELKPKVDKKVLLHTHPDHPRTLCEASVLNLSLIHI